VTAELEPPVEFAVVGQQYLSPHRIEHPSRAGQMAREATPQQAIVVRLDEADGLGRHRRFVGVERAGGVSAEEIENGSAVHRKEENR